MIGYSGEGERSFRWQGEREGEQQSERSDADLVIEE